MSRKESAFDRCVTLVRNLKMSLNGLRRASNASGSGVRSRNLRRSVRRDRFRLATQVSDPLERRIVPASFSASGGHLALNTTFDNETLNVSFLDETHVQFTLGTENEDAWVGIDDPVAGFRGNGLQTLTVDITKFSVPTPSTSPSISVSGANSAVTIVGAGEDQPFPFDFYLSLSGDRGSVHFTGDTARFSGRLNMNVSHLGHHSYEETAADVQRVDFDVPVIVEGPVSIESAGHLQFDQPFTIVGGEENVWDGVETHIVGMSIVAEQISVNAKVSTADADGPGGRSVTPSIQMLSLGSISLNAEVATGDVVSATEDPFYGILSSGEILLRAGGDPSGSAYSTGAVIGSENGRVRTGNVHHLSGGSAHSGSARVESVFGRIEMAATDAVATGNALTSPVEEQNLFTSSGNIHFYAGSGISSDDAGGMLSVFTGTAMPSTGAGFDNAGYGKLYVNDFWSMPANGDVHISSSGVLRVQHVLTDPDHSNVVRIESTSGLLIVQLFPFFGDDFSGLSGDQVSFLSSSVGGQIEFLEAVPNLGIQFGDGSLSLVSDGFYSRPWIGSGPEVVPNILAGSGTVHLRAFTNEGISLGAADSNPETADVVIGTEWMDLFRPGFTEFIIGDDDSVPVININADFHSDSSLTLIAQKILGSGIVSSDSSLHLLSSQGTIGTEDHKIRVFAADSIRFETHASGSNGSVFARILNESFDFGIPQLETVPLILIDTFEDVQRVVLDGETAFISSLTILDDNLELNLSNSLMGSDLLSAASMNILSNNGIQGAFQTTDGDLTLHSQSEAIGSQETPVSVDVAGKLFIETEGPGGPAGDVFVLSTSHLSVGSLVTGPDPDVVQISTTTGDIILESPFVLNDDVSITSAGAVILSAEGTLEAGSIQIGAQSSIYGPAMLLTTASTGVNLISTNGELGESGLPLTISVENSGSLSTTSSFNQYLSTPGTTLIQQLDADLAQIHFNGGIFQLMSGDSIDDSSGLNVHTGSSLDLTSHHELVGGLGIFGGAVVSTGGSVVSTSGQVFVTTGEASGLGGHQDIYKYETGYFTFNGDNLTTGQVIVTNGTVVLAPGANLTNSTLHISGDGIATSIAPTPEISAGTVHISNAGLLTAGNSPGQFGMQHLTSSPGGRILIEIMGESPGTGYDQIIATESVDISDVEFNLQISEFLPVDGSQFRILDNQSELPVTGTFNGLPEGAVFNVSGVDLQITYVGGDGNDIVVALYTPGGPSDIILDHSTILENQPVNTLIGILSTIEDNTEVSHTFELIEGPGSDDNHRFTIVNGNELRTLGVFDFEVQNSLVVRVRSTGSNGFSIEKSFTVMVQDVTELVGIDVQAGQNQRSFVRYLDAIFDRPEEITTLLSENHLQLYRFDLNGLNPQSVPLPTYSISGNTVQFDFGFQGIGGNRNSNVGDGYYQLVLDSQVRSFHRLLGDVTGDGKVDAADKSQALLANRTAEPESDANGDGLVNLTDISLISRAFGRKIKDDLFTDD
ncbi:MAG: hypothetical protein JNL58_02625 [Planctomyces sp.]|nr:hypothetical protein [Planctomyces sp.]